MKGVGAAVVISILALTALSCASGGAKKSAKPDAKWMLTQKDPVIAVKIRGTVHRFGRNELLHSPLAQKITVPNDPTYHKTMTYTAVPASLIFGGIDADSATTLLFTCADGFSAPISASRVLNMNPTTSTAYIAIEDPGAPWPEIGKGASHKSAGPFYLVWQNPEAAGVRQEEWPYQLVGFELKPSLEKQFPHILPEAKLRENSPVKKGYALFVQNCFTCHTMNGEGTATMGPDLNLPMNPTEYLRPGILEKLIRDNQMVRHWSQAQMSKFAPDTLTDNDIRNIAAYLKHMVGRKNR